MSQLAASGLSILTGVLYDEIGFASAYKLIGMVVAFFVIVSMFVLTSDKKPTQSAIFNNNKVPSPHNEVN